MPKLKKDLSFDELENLVRAAIRERFGDDETYVRETFQKHVIVRASDEKLYKLTYAIDKDNNVTLGEEMTPVEVQYVKISEALALKIIEAKDAKGVEWDVVVIEAGTSDNGAHYPPEVLQAATPLFEGIRALARTDEEHLRDVKRSVKDIVGWFSAPRYDAANKRVIARFHIAESAAWLRELMLDAWQQGKKDIAGFSIVAEGRACKKKMGQALVTYVDSIEKVFTVDVVLNPSAGGKFLKLVAGVDPNLKEEAEMLKNLLTLLESKAPDLYKKIDPENVTPEQVLALLTEAMEKPAESGISPETATALLAGVRTLIEAQQDTDDKDLLAEVVKLAEATAQKTVKLAECRLLLKEKLLDSKLPELAHKRLEKRFAGAVFEPAELDAAITEEREYLAKLSESGRVSGCGGVAHSGLESRDQLQYAMDRLFGLDVPSEAQGIPRLAGLREAYVQMSGDVDISGRFNPHQRVTLREAFDSGTFTYILANTLGRRMLKDYRAVDYHERDIITIRPSVSDFKTQTAIREGYFGDIDDINPETGDYQELGSYTDEAATYSVGQKGNLITITRKHIKNDDLGRVVKKISRAGRAARRTFARYVWTFIIGNAAIYDGKALFHADHGNLGTDALAYDKLHDAAIALSKMIEPGSGERLGWPSEKFNLFIPVELRGTAIRAIDTPEVPGGSSNDANPAHNIANIKIVPLMTDTTDWILSCPIADRDIIEVAFMDGNEEPELFVADNPAVGKMFTADKLQYKIRHEYGGAVVDYRGIYKAVVAG